MNRQTALLGVLLLVIAGVVLLPAEIACSQDTSNENERVRHGVDTPFYTLRGPDAPMIALIQTEEEVEYIGDYIGLDNKRAGSALRLLRHVDFQEHMLLVVNGGLVEGAMLRIEAVYEQNGELHVEVTTEEPPQQYRDSDFASPTSDTYSPSLVTLLPKFQGRMIVHVFPAEWATSGDLRGIELIVSSSSADTTGESGSGENSDDNL